ncbi:hypothetical protein KFL_005760070 [Klebsormidium nitens]|uniref:Thioredoxin domain-containing protein n=1 Tax=Klebsormidium nitens TaxID=105231 RepID=A0A1Y1IGZ3_KLENI|nr:hypothetical protein KFL_005760070 [Klebsormidium nitens]|eukprot:GAQ89913.1 hypothetical protein KFL_005760070 [Klebsormidium nitens]
MAAKRSFRLCSLVFLSLLCFSHSAGANVIDDDNTARLLELNDKTFEHDTQAASGQTTGVWFVLFGAPNCPACEAIEKAFRELAQDFEDNAILAKVDVTGNPVTAYRFDIQSTPILKLFRDRKMYSYTGGHSADQFREFLEGGYRAAPAESVPLEKGVVQQLREKLATAWAEYNKLNPLARLSGALLLLLVATSLIRFQQAGTDRVKKTSARVKQLHKAQQEKKGR